MMNKSNFDYKRQTTALTTTKSKLVSSKKLIMRYATLITLFSGSFWALIAAVPLQQQHNNNQIKGENHLVPEWETRSNDAWSSYELNPLIKPAGQKLALRVKREAATTESTPPKKPQGGKNKRSFEKDCLRAHNKWRKLHGAQDLKIDKKITAFAQKRADYIAASDGDKFEHPPNLPFGENLAWNSNEKTSCYDLIKMWYDELKLYDFSDPKFAMDTGHFTQLVWKATTKVGCAYSISDGAKGGIYLVCNYDPPGNFLGEFKENVLPAGSAVEGGDKGTTTATTTTTTTSTTSTTTVATTTAERSPTSRADFITPPKANTAATAISNRSSTEATTTTPATTKRPDKKKKSKKNKNKNKKSGRSDDEKEKKKENKKKGNKKKNKRKQKKKATTTTTSTTTTTQRSI